MQWISSYRKYATTYMIYGHRVHCQLSSQYDVPFINIKRLSFLWTQVCLLGEQTTILYGSGPLFQKNITINHNDISYHNI